MRTAGTLVVILSVVAVHAGLPACGASSGARPPDAKDSAVEPSVDLPSVPDTVEQVSPTDLQEGKTPPPADASGEAAADGAIEASPDEVTPDGKPGPCSEVMFEDVMIPMRDGKSLSAFVRRPMDPGCKLPAVLIQTPYDKENARKTWFQSDSPQPLFDSRDYAFVVLDWRGFWGSKAAAVPAPVPYGEDGFDAVEWIATQPWSDGKVGLWGVSALCRVQYMTAVEKPPHLAAAVPIFCGMNQTYRQYYPGGVLRREYFTFLQSYFGAGDVVLEHPYYDATWKFIEKAVNPADVQVPMLVIAGWFDLDNYSTLRDFERLRNETAKPVKDEHRLLIGPWIHFATGGETAGGVPLDEQELKFVDKDKLVQTSALGFFDLHLRALPGTGPFPDFVHYSRGLDQEYADAPYWPPAGAMETAWYLAPEGKLQDELPAAGQIVIPYDPDDPSPTQGGQTLLSKHDHGPQLQGMVTGRPDAAAFQTDWLAQDLHLSGPIRVELDVATTGLDTDFAIRFTDVQPDGAHLLVGEGITRLKLKDSLTKPSPLAPGERYSVVVEMTNELAWTFVAGHAVGIIVTSSNYDRFDRNPNNGEDFYSTADTSVAVDNTLFLDGSSRLVVRIE